jgi:hypothetical protein
LGVLKKALPIPDTTQERLLRRHGFEVARGMISAVVKTELASWNATEQGGESVAREAQVLTRIGKILETRILTRISQIASPFGP